MSWIWDHLKENTILGQLAKIEFGLNISNSIVTMPDFLNLIIVS